MDYEFTLPIFDINFELTILQNCLQIVCHEK